LFLRVKRSHKGSGKAALLFSASIIFFCFVFSNVSVAGKGDSFPLFGLSGANKSVEESNSVSIKTEGAVVEVCNLISKGDFKGAGQLIESTDVSELSEQEKQQFGQLSRIVQAYQQIEKQRQSSKEKAYLEQVDKLKKFESGQASSDVNDISDVNDVNDSNDLQSVLSAITMAEDFAGKEQKKELLAMPFVKDRSEGVKLESEGEWLDAYINCYYWLKEIYKGQDEGKKYSEHAEDLSDKANLAATFEEKEEDDLCQSSRMRYEGVTKHAFKRAIDALNFNYVNINIDYHEMMLAGIKRCKLLGEVAMHNALTSTEGKKQTELLPGDKKKLTAWLSALDGLKDEVNALSSGMSKDKFKELFEDLLALNNASAGFPEGVVVAQFTEAALSVLDPYTVMIWPKQRKNFEKVITNEFTGIGIEISRAKGLLTVASLLPGTPAYKSGLDAGDVIVAVDGKKTKNMSMNCAVDYITGPAGTQVTLTIRSLGEENTHDVVVMRDKITVSTIRGWKRTQAGRWVYMLDEKNKIGYVRITSFSDKTANGLEKALVELENEGLKGLILDLRFNSGGLLSSAIEITNKFVEKGPIVSTQPRSQFGVWTYATAEKRNTHPDYPLVVLIDSWSASASEIVAGALGDKRHERAILVGDRTHGKGSVQGITGYPGDGAQLKYTMAYYHLPSGQKVESKKSVQAQGRNDWGVGPDIKVKLRTDELKDMLNAQRDNDVLVQTDHKKDDSSVTRYSVEEMLKSDAQLAVGVLVVKTQLISRGELIVN